MIAGNTSLASAGQPLDEAAKVSGASLITRAAVQGMILDGEGHFTERFVKNRSTLVKFIRATINLTFYSMVSTLMVGSGVDFAVDGRLSLLSVPEFIMLRLLGCDRRTAVFGVDGLDPPPVAGVNLPGLLVILPPRLGSSATIFLLRFPVLPVVLVLHRRSLSSTSAAATLLLELLRE
jgi:hypothetical protein